MSRFCYVALDANGRETQGTVTVNTQLEAITRVKEMGYFPTKIVELKPNARAPGSPEDKSKKARRSWSWMKLRVPGWGGVKAKHLAVFTRQLSTLIGAGLPLLRGLRLLEEQEENATLRAVIRDLSASIESGSTFSEAVSQHPRVFNRLFESMVRAGELGGVLEIVLQRLAEYQEKAQRIKGKVIAAMFYPVTVIVIATVIMGALMVFVVPKFQEVFAGLMDGKPMPVFTVMVLNLSQLIKNNVVATIATGAAVFGLFKLFGCTSLGRRIIDRLKLRVPALGPVFRKLAVARFARTLGTLMGSGVPILQSLNIVKDTAGNVIVAKAISSVHESVKEGETVALPLKLSGVFPAMVVGMIDVGEQTGALPEMLMKVADVYEEEVDNAVAAMTSLLEPIMIVILAVVVGSIVIALFLPIISIMDGGFESRGNAD